MGVVTCKLFRITGKREYALDIMRELKVMGVMEPVEPLHAIDREDQQNYYDFVAARLERYHRVIEMLQAAADNPKAAGKVVQINAKKLKSLEKEGEAIDLRVNQVLDISAERDGLLEQRNALVKRLAELEPFSEVTAPLLGQFDLFSLRIVRIDQDKAKGFAAEMKQAEFISYYPVKMTEQEEWGFLIFPKDREAVVDKMLANSVNFVLDSSHFDEKGSPQEVYSVLGERRAELDKQVAKIEGELGTIAAKELERFMAMHDLLLWEKGSIEALRFVSEAYGSTVENPTVMVEGWMDPAEAGALKQQLRKIDSSIDLTDLGGETSPGVRSVLRNNVLVRPFQVVTQLMGTPHPTELDPSAFVAPFFVVFFGFALGDAGYGAIMVAAALWYLLVKKVAGSMKDAVLLLLYCGISTIVFGALTGGWFGIDLTTVQGTLGETLRSFQLINIQDKIIAVLFGALAIGFLHQIFGLTLKFISLVRNGQTAEAFSVPGTWILLLLSIIFFATAGMVPAFESIAAYKTQILIGAGVLFAFGQGYGTRNLLLRPAKGAASLFNITSYLSNTLSYARLLALGLATGVIGNVVNFIAGMAGGGGKTILGVLIMIVVLLIGHTFNIAMNLLGTFINVVRLQLVEFFPQFYEAKGTELAPLRLQPQYAAITPDVGIAIADEHHR